MKFLSLFPIQAILLTTLSAILVVICFPPLDLSLLAPIAWLPLFLALQDKSPTTAGLLGLLHGFLVFSIGASWFFDIFHLAATLLWLILGSFTALWA